MRGRSAFERSTPLAPRLRGGAGVHKHGGGWRWGGYRLGVRAHAHDVQRGTGREAQVQRQAPPLQLQRQSRSAAELPCAVVGSPAAPVRCGLSAGEARGHAAGVCS